MNEYIYTKPFLLFFLILFYRRLSMKIHTHTHITRARLTSVSQQLSHANVNRFSFYRITSIYKHSETNRSNQVTKLKEKTTHTKHTQPNGINRNIKIEQKLLFFRYPSHHQLQNILVYIRI